MSLLDLDAKTLLDRFASSDPTPGGGSAAALAGALGAGLVSMVCAMPKTKQGTPDDRARLDTALGWAREAAARLRSLVDEDAQAYDGVVAAYRLPKASEDEKEARRLAIAKAMSRATEVPLETAESCLVVIRAAGVALAHGNPNAHSDARTALALAFAGLRGAAENVKTNADGRAELLELQQRVLAVLAEGEAAALDRV